MKIKRFNENLDLDTIKSLFSYAIDLSDGFRYEYEEDEDDKIYIIHLSHSFYGISSYDDFIKFVDFLNEVRDVCDKLEKLYNSRILFDERSNARITIQINFN